MPVDDDVMALAERLAGRRWERIDIVEDLIYFRERVRREQYREWVAGSWKGPEEPTSWAAAREMRSKPLATAPRQPKIGDVVIYHV